VHLRLNLNVSHRLALISSLNSNSMQLLTPIATLLPFLAVSMSPLTALATLFLLLNSWLSFVSFSNLSSKILIVYSYILCILDTSSRCSFSSLSFFSAVYSIPFCRISKYESHIFYSKLPLSLQCTVIYLTSSFMHAVYNTPIYAKISANCMSSFNSKDPIISSNHFCNSTTSFRLVGFVNNGWRFWRL